MLSPNAPHELTPALAHALQLLAEGERFAALHECNPWLFAVSLEELEGVGCTRNGIRSLLLSGCIEHAHEIAGDRARRFKKQKSLGLDRHSCFILTDAGRHQAQHSQDRAPAQFAGVLKPRFVDDTLWVGTHLIKRYLQPAPSQVTILKSFEERHWVAEMDDPLPLTGLIGAQDHLRQTIANLNRNQRKPLLRFYGVGCGKKIGWRWR